MRDRFIDFKFDDELFNIRNQHEWDIKFAVIETTPNGTRFATGCINLSRSKVFAKRADKRNKIPSIIVSLSNNDKYGFYKTSRIVTEEELNAVIERAKVNYE